MPPDISLERDSPVCPGAYTSKESDILYMRVDCDAGILRAVLFMHLCIGLLALSIFAILTMFIIIITTVFWLRLWRVLIDVQCLVADGLLLALSAEEGFFYGTLEENQACLARYRAQRKDEVVEQKATSMLKEEATILSTVQPISLPEALLAEKTCDNKAVDVLRSCDINIPPEEVSSLPEYENDAPQKQGNRSAPVESKVSRSNPPVKDAATEVKTPQARTPTNTSSASASDTRVTDPNRDFEKGVDNVDPVYVDRNGRPCPAQFAYTPPPTTQQAQEVEAAIDKLFKPRAVGTRNAWARPQASGRNATQSMGRTARSNHRTPSPMKKPPHVNGTWPASAALAAEKEEVFEWSDGAQQMSIQPKPTAQGNAAVSIAAALTAQDSFDVAPEDDLISLI